MGLYADAQNKAQGSGRLGPWPVAAVTVFADLGMDDGEIARYFGVAPSLIAQLRQAGRRGRQPVFQGGSLLEAWRPRDPPATPPW
ncbi:hypothetical protein KUW17_21890 [Leisingera aquaemixtae]|uniref:hypothetical protein n=1 Tax=Leisingera aquaemixtae TaxID=1396826 RepID=UPI001C95B328|nr:hypothetical protein [Leisingera aquaemixtae]MBY6069411.1 hypothetical protein [Leisingera aquaemixtae]